MKKVISIWLLLIVVCGLLFFLFQSLWNKVQIEETVKRDIIRIEKKYDYHWGRQPSPKEERLRIISNIFGSAFLLSLLIGIPHISYTLIKRKKK
ncbi:hypothetical protein ACFL1I_08040 [Candidatus Omnitrophota bacterium]